MRFLLASLAALAATPLPAQSFLWEARSAQGTIYLLGSIHLLTPDAYPLAPAIEQAYAASDVAVFELDLGEVQAGAMALMQAGLYADGSALCDHVAPATCALVTSRLDSLAMLRPAVERAEPWLAGMLLTTGTLAEAGYRADLGLDHHFYARATADAKPTRGLETLAQQVAFFDTLPHAEQEAFLRYTLDEIDRAVASVDALVAAWKAGDAQALVALSGDLDAMPALRARLLTERNRAWVPTLAALVAEGRTPFVVVGALHLVGPDGLLALLEAEGYTVTQR